jgi:hypothetical protein
LGSSFGLVVGSWTHEVSFTNVIFDLNGLIVVRKF